MLRAICFDAHGTLLRPQRAAGPDRTSVAIQGLLESFGVSISYQAWEAAYGMAWYIDYPRRGAASWDEFLGYAFDRLGEPLTVEAQGEIVARFAAQPEWEPFPDGIEALQAAKERGLATAVFTTIPRFRVKRFLAVVDSVLDLYFDGQAAGDSKGSRRYYERLLDRLGVEPDEALAVGDGMFTDVEMPRRVGMRAVLLDRAGRSPTASVPVIQSLPELAALL